ncbi:MAG: hypothetical protein JRH20_27240 [Deltaproteobacteria bacterium]|nr:hypothetical protein [Deltaproteobacteria bacterium]
MELAVGEIYILLSRSFRHDPRLRALFGLLASEEDAHARRVREVAQLWQEKGINTPPTLNIQRYRHLLAHAQLLRQKLALVDEIDESTAFELAATLENDFNDVHAESLAANHDPMLVMLFTELAEGDRGHAALIARDAEKSKESASELQD